MPIAVAAIVIGTDWLAAVACFPALSWSRAARTGVLTLAGAGIAISPVLLPSTSPRLRLLVAFSAVWLLCKLYDLHVGAARGMRPDWATFARYLPNPFWIVCRKPPAGTLSRGAAWSALARRALGFMAAMVPAGIVFGWDWRGVPFLAEHAAKALTLYAFLAGFYWTLAAVYRLLGQPVLDPIDRPLLAHSPADFWRRWNRPAQQFFREDLYTPLGGRRAPIRALLLTFLVSAVVHEYLFDVAVGRVTGYQTMFFLIQGIAAALTPRVPRTATTIALTFAFNLTTSVLFFASVAAVLPLYDNALPPWLLALDLSRTVLAR